MKLVRILLKMVVLVIVWKKMVGIVVKQALSHVLLTLFVEMVKLIHLRNVILVQLLLTDVSVAKFNLDGIVTNPNLHNVDLILVVTISFKRIKNAKLHFLVLPNGVTTTAH